MDSLPNSAFERFGGKPILFDAMDGPGIQGRLLHFRREISGDEDRRYGRPLPDDRPDDIDARLGSEPVVGDHDVIMAGCYAFTSG